MRVTNWLSTSIQRKAQLGASTHATEANSKHCYSHNTMEEVTTMTVVNDPTRQVPPPRHTVAVHPHVLENAQQVLARAEADYIAALDKLNAEYLGILTLASANYGNAVDRSQRLYHAIEQPARARYERETEMAEIAARGIVEPAQIEFDRLVKAALDMYQRAIRPLDEQYQRAATTVNNTIVQSTTNPTVP